MDMVIMKVQEIKSATGTRYSITIPKKIIQFLDWHKGTELEFILGKNKEIIIKENQK